MKIILFYDFKDRSLNFHFYILNQFKIARMIFYIVKIETIQTLFTI